MVNCTYCTIRATSTTETKTSCAFVVGANEVHVLSQINVPTFCKLRITITEPYSDHDRLYFLYALIAILTTILFCVYVYNNIFNLDRWHFTIFVRTVK